MRTIMLMSGLTSAMFAVAAEGAAAAETPNTGVVAINASLPTLKPFDPEAPALFGNGFLESLIKQTQFDEEIQSALQTGDEVKRYIGFELTKAIMSVSETTKDMNIYAIFEGAKATEKLNSKLLQSFGVIKKEIKDDDIIVKWTSPEMEAAYDYSSIDKEKNEAEYTRRFNNRKRLNMRFSEGLKAAIALIDAGTKSEQLKLVENADTKQVEPVIENAPDVLRGDKTKNGSTITFGKRTANEGAKVASNMTALVKAATEAHKKSDPETTGTPGERADKGNDRSGEAKLGMDDETFGGLVNNLRRAIGAQEGNLSADMIKQLSGLHAYITEQVNATKAKAAAGEASAAKK